MLTVHYCMTCVYICVVYVCVLFITWMRYFASHQHLKLYDFSKHRFKNAIFDEKKNRSPFITFTYFICMCVFNIEIWFESTFIFYVGVLNYKSLSLTKQKYARHLSPFLFPFCIGFSLLFTLSLSLHFVKICVIYLVRCRVVTIHKKNSRMCEKKTAMSSWKFKITKHAK